MKKIDPKNLSQNVFSLIGDQWMLITAGTAEQCNTMTASWGGLGVIWGSPAATCYIRPQRYTLEFVEREDYYSLCFFGPDCRQALNLCGSKSGREIDKDAATGLTPCFDEAAPYYEQARLVFLCRKLYRQDLEEGCFLDKGLLEKWYDNDLHRMFIGEIVKVLEKE